MNELSRQRKVSFGHRCWSGHPANTAARRRASAFMPMGKPRNSGVGSRTRSPGKSRISSCAGGRFSPNLAGAPCGPGLKRGSVAGMRCPPFHPCRVPYLTLLPDTAGIVIARAGTSRCRPFSFRGWDTPSAYRGRRGHDQRHRPDRRRRGSLLLCPVTASNGICLTQEDARGPRTRKPHGQLYDSSTSLEQSKCSTACAWDSADIL